MPFKDIELDPNSREWVEEITDSWSGHPFEHYLADIIGSSCSIAKRFNFEFPEICKNYRFTVSFNDGGWDKDDIERIEYIHSINNTNKKGLSVRGSGLRGNIESMYQGMNIDEKNEQHCTRIITRCESYKNGETTTILFAPGMRINIRPANDQEQKKFLRYMDSNHNSEYGTYAIFCVNDELAVQIFSNKDSKIVDDNIKSKLVMILNRRMVNEDGTPGEVSLFINKDKIQPSKRFIHSHHENRHIAIEAWRRAYKHKGKRRPCLKLTDECIKKINQLK